MQPTFKLRQGRARALFSQAWTAYAGDCHRRGVTPARVSPIKSSISDQFVELRTEVNGKLGVFFPATAEFLRYIDQP